jgi:DNA polymerase-3 subunit gamma/tau
MTAINIANQADLSYKESRNQRLHIELALMKMAHIPSAVLLASQPATQSTQAAQTSSEGLKKKLA